MSDDEADPELLELLRASLAGGNAHKSAPTNTHVLEHAEYIYDNAIDVAIVSDRTRNAAELIWSQMQQKSYSTSTWGKHELHAKALALSDGESEGHGGQDTVAFIFTMDLLNFSFWSEMSDPAERFAVEYGGVRWTGYWSLVAALHRALDDGYAVTSPEFWTSEEFSEEVLGRIFRSATSEPVPMLRERLECLKQAGEVLMENFNGSFTTCIKQANGSAPALVNLLADNFECFRDEATFDGKRVRLLKRTQLVVGDLWACFEGKGYGKFNDIDSITMFADYRVVQMLRVLGCLYYSPKLENHIQSHALIESGHPWEVQLRGCSIWCVELIRREILRKHPEAEVNAILIDFFLYDTIKEQQASLEEACPHHRTRSIWY